jgi:hypothetical protein
MSSEVEVPRKNQRLLCVVLTSFLFIVLSLIAVVPDLNGALLPKESQYAVERMTTPAPSLPLPSTSAAPLVARVDFVERVTEPPAPDAVPERVVLIVYADDVDRAVQMIVENGIGKFCRVILVVSDERMMSFALKGLQGANVSATVVLMGECGQQVVVKRVAVLAVDKGIYDIHVQPCSLPTSSASQRVSRWTSIASGAFLLDAVGAVLSFRFPGPATTDGELFIAHQTPVVAVDPQEVWLCGKLTEVASHLLRLFRPETAPTEYAKLAFAPIPRSVAMQRVNDTLRHSTKLFIGQWRTFHKKHGHAASGDPYERLLHSDLSTVVSPYIFGGTKKSLMALAASTNELRVRYPTPPGFAMEMVLAAALNEVREGRSSVQLKMRLISERDVLMLTPTSCTVIQQCANHRSQTSSPPPILLNTRHCMWSKPLQPPPVVRPSCHSRWFDDYYLLHESNGNDAARMIPSALVAPSLLEAAWGAMRSDAASKAGGATAATVQPPIEEPHLRRCVGRGRSAVLGMCLGYPPGMVAAFVNTFAKFHTRSCTQLYLFVEDQQRAAYNATFGGEPDVVIVAIDALRSTLRLRSCGVVHWRKELLHEWLLLKERSEEDAHWLRYVMVVDTRDAHFQADPFEPLRTMVPEVRGRLDAVKRSSPRAAGAGVLYLLPERFEAGSASFLDSVMFVLRDRSVETCGDGAYQWGLQQPLRPLLPAVMDRAEAESQLRGAYPLEALPYLSTALYFGDYAAMKATLKLMTDSMGACASGSSPCGTSNDQGMLHCLGMGGFDSVKFAHDVVMLNPDTHPYTHMFRYSSFIQFYEPGAQASPGHLGNAFVYPCAESQRSRSFNKGRVTVNESDQVAPYAVVHESEYEPEYHFYIAESLSKL